MYLFITVVFDVEVHPFFSSSSCLNYLFKYNRVALINQVLNFFTSYPQNSFVPSKEIPYKFKPPSLLPSPVEKMECPKRG